MGCEIATLLKCVITAINVILGIAFLVVAVLGLLLKTSVGFVKSLLRASFSFGGDLTDDEAKYLTEFVREHATSFSIISIVVGLALAALCFVGAFAACCICGLLLKIYAITLGVLLVAQIVAVAVLFSNPTQLSQPWRKALMQLLKHYYRGTAMENASITIWNFIMTFNGTCCGMNGAIDFRDLTTAPGPCCGDGKPYCLHDDAKSAAIPGCEGRITSFLLKHLKIIMYVAIGAIFIQAALLAVVVCAICL